MGRLLNLIIVISGASSSLVEHLGFEAQSSHQNLSIARSQIAVFSDLIKELTDNGKVTGFDANKLVLTLREFMMITSIRGFRWSHTSLDSAKAIVVNRVLGYFEESGHSIQRIKVMQRVLDYLLLASSIQPMDEVILTSSIFNTLFLVDWVSDSALDESSLPVHHRKLVYAMKESQHLFPDHSKIPSVFASIIQFRDKTLESLYIDCLKFKSTSDRFLFFVHKQLTCDKLSEFSREHPRSIHGEMYTRLFSACDSWTAAGSGRLDLLNNEYRTIVQSDEFTQSRDFVKKTDVERILVGVVILGYELSTLVPERVPNILQYLLWCLTVDSMGRFTETNADQLKRLYDVLYHVRTHMDHMRPLTIETFLIDEIGNGFDHAKMMIRALGFERGETDGGCQGRFPRNETLVSHCDYVVNIVVRSCEFAKTHLVHAAGLTRLILTGAWYMLRGIGSPVFVSDPGCIDRPVMIMEAFIIKCKREIALGAASISAEAGDFLARAVGAVLQEFELD